MKRRRAVELPMPGETWKEVSILYHYYKQKKEVQMVDLLRLIRYAVHLEEVYGPDLLSRYERSQDRPIYIHLKDEVDTSGNP